MELDLQIIKDPCRDVGKHSIRVFGEKGGVIGRALDSFWLLPDPKRYVSGHHCTVERRGDVYWLTDTSRNGVFLNDAAEPIGYLNEVRLRDGDRLGIGLYKVLVRFRERPRSVPHSHRMKESHSAPVQPPEDVGGKTVTILETTGEHEIHAGDMAVATGEYEVHADDISVTTGEQAITGGESTGEHETIAEQEGGEIASDAAEIKPLEAIIRDVTSPVAAEPTVEAPTVHPTSARIVNIDRERLQALGHLPPKDKERLVANQFRHIKRSLLANAIGRGGAAVPNGRLIMVTSALPGEGKTFSVLNLALSLAREKDLEVVVIDADSAKQQISCILGVEREEGLLDVLMDDARDVESVILRTDTKSLSILPAGNCEEDVVTELLTSSRMDEIVARIGTKNSRRIAIFDSSPLLLTNESRALAAVVGQVVLVVKADVTPKQAVEEAISYLDEGKPLGLILNQSKAGGPGDYYGYGAYGYGAYYGSYGDSAKGEGK